MTSIADRALWLADPVLQKLLSALSADGEDARIAGGAVRNTLMGEPVTDIDIATTNLPEATIARAEAAGFKAVPTGIDHGTVTIIGAGRPFEVTTLRADIETDGRHARVLFGRDWTADAERRDFTINALYAQADGTVIDLVGGIEDISSRTLRFIGDAETRIREDYLRILRFFRFFAWYGSGRPDAEGLKACARLKEGLDRLSAERVWSEMRKLFAAPDPSRALLWMRQTGVLTRILPEGEKWGIDAIGPLIALERERDIDPDAMLRLMAIVPPDAARMAALADRLKLSGAEKQRLVSWALAMPLPQTFDSADMRKRLYLSGRQPILDGLALKAATNGDAAAALDEASAWDVPALPVGGKDLAQAGHAPGPQMGETLRQLEKEWIASDFQLDREALLQRLAGVETRRD